MPPPNSSSASSAAASSAPAVDPQIDADCRAFRRDYQLLAAEIGKAIVGHQAIIDGVLTCLFAGGHVLLEGVPGLGKTALVRALADSLNLKFSRVQFTPDLLPADIVGTNILSESEHGARTFTFSPGPIFAPIVLADEINRALPRTQSALLEAMQERQVTAGGQSRKLPEPFMVLATQNPLEHEGTYPLPEAQIDRFFFKLLLDYSGRGELNEIVRRTTGAYVAEIRPVLDAAGILAHQRTVRRVVIAPPVGDYAVRCVLATHAHRLLRVGASPRAAQAMVLGAKVRALTQGRLHVAAEDVAAVALPAMRHRVILNFEAEAQGVSADAIIAEAIARTPPSGDGDQAKF
jgi:MoxR-like ATPase